MKGDCALPLKEKRMWLLHDAVAQLIFLFKPMCKGRETMCQVYPVWKECNCSGSEAKLRISYSLMYLGTRV